MMPGYLANVAAPTFFWSGVIVAGAVTAVAKFKVTTTPRHELLRVGKAQFTALRRVEACAATATMISALREPNSYTVKVVSFAVSALLAQAFITVPLMRRRQGAPMKEKSNDESDKQESGNSMPHIAHVTLEMVKLTACVAAGVMGN